MNNNEEEEMDKLNEIVKEIENGYAPLIKQL